MATRTLITPGQEKQYRRLVEDAAKYGADLALEKVALDKDGFQQFLGRGDEFKTALTEVIVGQTRQLSITDQFADEEVSSSYGYPADYAVKGIAEQIAILRKVFPRIGSFDEKLAKKSLPAGAEDWVAIPDWRKIAPTYNKAVEKVVAVIASQRKFYNFRKGRLGPQYLRQHPRSVKMFARLAEEQKGSDILVVPCQFGLRHRGRSVRRARAVLTAKESELGAFAVGCMLLIHPEREVNLDQLHIDCGDEYSPYGDGDFDYAMCFLFSDGRLGFDGCWVDYADDGYGLASGFVGE